MFMAKMENSFALASGRLKDLRELSGYSLEDIAKKMKVPVEELNKIEGSNLKVDLQQIKKFSNMYNRPLAAFFSEAPPQPIHKIADHRINREKKEVPEIYAAERRAYYLANKITQLSDKRSKIPAFSGDLSAIEFARKFREYFKQTGIELLKSSSPAKTLDYYKSAIENDFSIVVTESPFKSDDIRALCITNEISIIVLNEKDKSEIKLFSLFHELCHLAKKTGSLCSLDMELNGEAFEETFCDEFAAEMTVPKTDIEKEISNIDKIDYRAISSLSKVYGVSKQVVYLKLYYMGRVDKGAYIGFASRKIEKQKLKGKGGKNWNKTFRNRVGNLVIGEVKRNYGEKNISLIEAIEILGVKSKYAQGMLKR